jgi:hypothetical protein
MNNVKSLWKLVQGDPNFMRSVNGWFTIFWIAMIPISYSLHWLSSVTYVSALSLWALVSGHWAAWQAARVEVKQKNEDIPGDVIKKMVKKTEITAAKTSNKKRR